PILRWLALISDFTEMEASVLKALIPDIDTLLQRSVPDAPPVNPQAGQERLFNIIAAILNRQEQPLVMLLEDLHLAGSESLALLPALSPKVNTLPLLFLTSYRSDERPDLPEMFPDSQVLKLSRFSSRAVEELCEAMLGSAARQEPILSFLERETEG